MLGLVVGHLSTCEVVRRTKMDGIVLLLPCFTSLFMGCVIPLGELLRHPKYEVILNCCETLVFFFGILSLQQKWFIATPMLQRLFKLLP